MNLYYTILLMVGECLFLKTKTTMIDNLTIMYSFRPSLILMDPFLGCPYFFLPHNTLSCNLFALLFSTIRPYTYLPTSFSLLLHFPGIFCQNGFWQIIWDERSKCINTPPRPSYMMHLHAKTSMTNKIMSLNMSHRSPATRFVTQLFSILAC